MRLPLVFYVLGFRRAVSYNQPAPFSGSSLKMIRAQLYKKFLLVWNCLHSSQPDPVLKQFNQDLSSISFTVSQTSIIITSSHLCIINLVGMSFHTSTVVTALQAGRSRFGYPTESFGFLTELILPAALWPWVRQPLTEMGAWIISWR